MKPKTRDLGVKMRKNDLVTLDNDKCFTTARGGKRALPLSNHFNDENGTVDGFFKLTQEDRDRLRESGRYDGMDSAGEPKLVPSEGIARLKRDYVYQVLRARCAAVRNYRTVSGLALVLCTNTGRNIYVKRELLKVVG